MKFACFKYIMTKQTFYQKLDQSTTLIQNLSSSLTKDFDTARQLYLETAHLAMKNRKSLKEDNFEQWLDETVKQTFRKLSSQPV